MKKGTAIILGILLGAITTEGAFIAFTFILFIIAWIWFGSNNPNWGILGKVLEILSVLTVFGIPAIFGAIAGAVITLKRVARSE